MMRLGEFHNFRVDPMKVRLHHRPLIPASLSGQDQHRFEHGRRTDKDRVRPVDLELDLLEARFPLEAATIAQESRTSSHSSTTKSQDCVFLDAAQPPAEDFRRSRGTKHLDDTRRPLASRPRDPRGTQPRLPFHKEPAGWPPSSTRWSLPNIHTVTP